MTFVWIDTDTVHSEYVWKLGLHLNLALKLQNLRDSRLMHILGEVKLPINEDCILITWMNTISCFMVSL